MQDQLNALIAGLTRYPEDAAARAALTDFILERDPVLTPVGADVAGDGYNWFTSAFRAMAPRWVNVVFDDFRGPSRRRGQRQLRLMCQAAGLSVGRVATGSLRIGSEPGTAARTDWASTRAVWMRGATPNGCWN